MKIVSIILVYFESKNDILKSTKELLESTKHQYTLFVDKEKPKIDR